MRPTRAALDVHASLTMRRRTAATGRRGPSLAGTAARTAVVAGTVGAVKRGSAARGQASTTRAPDATDQVGAMIARLKELAELRDAGILTEAEFAKQKAKLLT